MASTVTYKGWISLASPRRGGDPTVILAPNKFLHIVKHHVIAEKISADIRTFGQYANVRVWAYHTKINPSREYLSHSFMGLMSAEYSEIFGSSKYRYTRHFINISTLNFLEELVYYHSHYCIIKITYHSTEYDMIAHEMELTLLDHDF